MPYGTIERWRDERSAAFAPVERGGDERVWRFPAEKAPIWVVAAQLPTLALLVSRPLASLAGAGPGVAVLILLGITAVAAAVFAVALRPDRLRVRADRHGLLLPRFRGPRRIPWSAVAAVRGTTGRWNDEPRLDLHDGTTVKLPATVPAAVIEQWRQDLAPGHPTDEIVTP
jgi:hypothetical protein